MSALRVERTPRRVPGRCEGVPDNRFVAFKVSRDGHHDQWDHEYRLTFAQARDDFPLGEFVEVKGRNKGRKYIWSFCLMKEYL